MEDRSIKYKKALETICFSSYFKPQRSSPQAKVKASSALKSSLKGKNDSQNNSNIDQNLIAVLNPVPNLKFNRQIRQRRNSLQNHLGKFGRFLKKRNLKMKGQLVARGKEKCAEFLRLLTFNASPGFGDSLKKLPSIVQMKLLVSYCSSTSVRTFGSLNITLLLRG